MTKKMIDINAMRSKSEAIALANEITPSLNLDMSPDYKPKSTLEENIINTIKDSNSQSSVLSILLINELNKSRTENETLTKQIRALEIKNKQLTKNEHQIIESRGNLTRLESFYKKRLATIPDMNFILDFTFHLASMIDCDNKFDCNKLDLKNEKWIYDGLEKIHDTVSKNKLEYCIFLLQKEFFLGKGIECLEHYRGDIISAFNPTFTAIAELSKSKNKEILHLDLNSEINSLKSTLNEMSIEIQALADELINKINSTISDKLYSLTSNQFHPEQNDDTTQLFSEFSDTIHEFWCKVKESYCTDIEYSQENYNIKIKKEIDVISKKATQIFANEFNGERFDENSKEMELFDKAFDIINTLNKSTSDAIHICKNKLDTLRGNKDLI
jgi:hypothetical protein